MEFLSILSLINYFLKMEKLYMIFKGFQKINNTINTRLKFVIKDLLIKTQFQIWKYQMNNYKIRML
jgi:hypothetical protein